MASVTYKGRVLQGRLERISDNGRLSTVYLFSHDSFSLDDWLLRFLLRYITFSFDLPRQVVLKQYETFMLSQDDAVATMEAEQSALRAMHPIQGTVVPRYYGRVNIEGAAQPALALQHLKGRNLWQWLKTRDLGVDDTSVEDVCQGISHALAEISKYGIMHGDIDTNKMDNLMLAEAKPLTFTLPSTITCVVLGIIYATSPLVATVWCCFVSIFTPAHDEADCLIARRRLGSVVLTTVHNFQIGIEAGVSHRFRRCGIH